MRSLKAACTAIFAIAWALPALAQSIDDEIQNEEQPGSEIGLGVPFGSLLERSMDMPPPPPASAAQPGAVLPLAEERPSLPPAEAYPGIPNSEETGAALDLPDDPDSPPALGADDDLSGPGDEDPFPED
jgi:hypothetical protein